MKYIIGLTIYTLVLQHLVEHNLAVAGVVIIISLGYMINDVNA